MLNWHSGNGAFAEITDFTAGSGADHDVVDISEILGSVLTGYTSGTDPFTAGFMQVVDDGGDTILQVNVDGVGSDWENVLTLDGVDFTTLTFANFSPSYSPTGTGENLSDPPGQNSNIVGSGSADTIAGNDGNDTIYGGAGDDSLDAGTGNDYVDGQGGNDSIVGGDGNDNLHGGDGADTVDGQGDNDSLYGENGNDCLLGDSGAGPDYIDGGAGDDTLIGHDGNDTFYDYQGNNSPEGDAGNDVFNLVGYGSGTDVFTGGTGQDTYYVNWTPGSATDEIKDFATGAGGDGWNIDALFSHFSGYNSAYGTNPFIEQDSPGTHGPYLQLAADGAGNTLLQISPNGDSTWFDIVKIDGVIDPNTLTNVGGYSPTGVGINLPGSSDGDVINGTSDADTISGNDGYDTVLGHNGDDTISGGNQNDQLFGQGGNDTISGDAGDDTISDSSSAMALPSVRAILGNSFGPKIKRASTKISMSSGMPIPNIYSTPTTAMLRGVSPKANVRVQSGSGKVKANGPVKKGQETPR